MTTFLQTVLDGIGNGAIYAGLALALVMVHRATHIPNFAQGEMATLSAFIGWDLQDRGVPWILALLGAIALSFLVGFVIQVGVIRWAEGAAILSLLILTLGVQAILNSGMGWRWGYLTKTVETPFPISPVSIGGAGLSWQSVGALMVLVVTLAAVYAVFSYTKLGLGLRGAAQNPQSAKLVGINVGAMLAIGWGLSGAIGASAGVMAAPKLSLQPNMLSAIMVFGFAAAVLGGFDSPPGAVLGGFLVAWIQSFAATYWPAVGNELSLVVALVVITAVLVIKPDGIFGKAKVQRV